MDDALFCAVACSSHVKQDGSSGSYEASERARGPPSSPRRNDDEAAHQLKSRGVITAFYIIPFHCRFSLFTFHFMRGRMREVLVWCRGLPLLPFACCPAVSGRTESKRLVDGIVSFVLRGAINHPS